ncbi:MAG: FAD-binding oxidoreductase, partial [Actinomycetota bacterium]|nr:FAD-binding oxidoreductase [Actinomycetota bacterium]
MPTTPTPPIELGSADQHLEGTWVPVQESVAESLSSICRITRLEGNELAVAELSRDWWPLALHWALAGEVGALAAVVAHPRSTEEASKVMSVCHDATIPVTAAGGRSGVCGGSIPVHGGVVIDLSEMNSIIEVDEVSGVVTAQCGVFGPDLEHFLRSEHS